ncbi:MAG: amidohydrolase family protein [Myxococcota bacterium]
MGQTEEDVFDAHFHIIDDRFPLVPNDGYLPPRFNVDDYRAATTGLGITEGAVVSGSFQAFDQTYLGAALQALGPGFVGVTQLPADVSEAEISRLHDLGVRAVRLNVRRGGSAPAAAADALARRVYEAAGWHTELYVDATELEPFFPLLRAVPCMGVDHLGLRASGLENLLRWVERGGFVKATGFGRLDFNPADALESLFAANPDALVFGTDLPSTRAPRAFTEADLATVRDALGTEAAERVLSANARAIYLK